MKPNNRIIFQSGQDTPINKEEFERLQQAYEQQKELVKRLVAWTKQAASDLEEYGYGPQSTESNKVIFINQIPNREWDGDNDEERYLLRYSFPGPIPDTATAMEKAACEVLKASDDLWKALSQDNKMLIANRGIDLGFAVAVAHATPYETKAKIGDRRQLIPVEAGRARGKQQTTNRLPEWERWRAEADKIRRDSPKIKSKKRIAEIVKKKLNLEEKPDTISRKI